MAYNDIIIMKLLIRDKMAILLTNISDNILNQDIIKESFIKLKNSNELTDEKINDHGWNSIDINLNKFKIDLNNDMDEVYDTITNIIKNSLNKKEFINVIVYTSFLAYIILEILIKNFDITDVFILKDDGLEKAHTCGCGPESRNIKLIECE